jgi:hypothetical protein
MERTRRWHWREVGNEIGRWLIVNDRWATSLSMAVFAALVLCGVTTSSMGISLLAQDVHHPLAVQLGQSQFIRSDEFNVNTPIALSMLSTGGSPTLSPLSAPADLVQRFTTGGFFESVVFFPSLLLWLGGILPQHILFAAYWWLPMILLFAAMPIWVSQVGGSRRMGWFATVAIALSPCVAWWSLGPVQCVGYTVAGCSLLVAAFRRFEQRRWASAIIFGLLSGILLASMPTLYAPWSITLGLPLLTTTVVWIFMQKSPILVRLGSVGLSGVVAVVFAAGVFLENLSGVLALAGTTYPGARRSSSIAQPLELLFGAPGLGTLTSAAPTASNASEISSSFTVCFVWAGILLVSGFAIRPLRDRIGLIVVGGWGTVWMLWATVSAGKLTSHIPLFNLVPPERVAQVVGILGILVVAFLLSNSPAIIGWRAPAVAAVSAALLTAWAVSLLGENYVPTVGAKIMFSASLGVAACVYILTRYPRRLWPIVVTAVLAAVPVILSQPVLVGFPDIRTSPTARAMMERGSVARSDGTLWASNSIEFDALMLANGVPSLSGLQRSGPDVPTWTKLDPGHRYKYAWNRAGGYVLFVFAPGEPTKITTNGADLTYVQADPCNLKEEIPSLGHIASMGRKVHASCLKPAGSVEWQSNPVYLYSVR